MTGCAPVSSVMMAAGGERPRGVVRSAPRPGTPRHRHRWAGSSIAPYVLTYAERCIGSGPSASQRRWRCSCSSGRCTCQAPGIQTELAVGQGGALRTVRDGHLVGRAGVPAKWAVLLMVVQAAASELTQASSSPSAAATGGILPPTSPASRWGRGSRAMVGSLNAEPPEPIAH